MKLNDFNKLLGSQKPEEKQEYKPSKIMYNYGSGSVLTTPEELAQRFGLDEQILLDYIQLYKGNINLATMAASNDKKVAESLSFLTRMLGVKYVMEQNPQDLLRKYNQLLEMREFVIFQLQFFSLGTKPQKYYKEIEEQVGIKVPKPSFSIQKEEHMSLTGNQLKLLMLKANPYNDAKKVINPSGKVPVYATDYKLSVMEGLVKISDAIPEELTVQECAALSKAFSDDLAISIAIRTGNGLSINKELAKQFLELFMLNTITTMKNIELFEELCESFGLNNTKEEKEHTEEGPTLSKRKPTK